MSDRFILSSAYRDLAHDLRKFLRRGHTYFKLKIEILNANSKKAKKDLAKEIFDMIEEAAAIECTYPLEKIEQIIEKHLQKLKE